MSLVADVEVRLDGFHEDVHLDVADGEVVAVLGPNGSGKTTLLRALAGVVPLTGGRIVLDGHRPRRSGRRASWSPPSSAHAGWSSRITSSSRTSTSWPMWRSARAGGVRRARRRRLSHGTGSTDWGWPGVRTSDRDRLSGGQSQRVALARALATGPRLLLLDEPMAALDVTQRTVVRQLLRDHVGGSGASCVLVTHDPLDATALADSLVLIDDGRMVQRGTAGEVARRPASPWVARLLGVNLLMGQVRAGWFDLGAGLGIPVPTAADGEWWAVLAPRDVAVTVYGAPEPEGIVVAGATRTAWTTRVTTVQPTGDRVVLGLEYPGDLTADVPAVSPGGTRWSEGMPVRASVIPTAVELFEPSSM